MVKNSLFFILLRYYTDTIVMTEDIDLDVVKFSIFSGCIDGLHTGGEDPALFQHKCLIAKAGSHIDIVDGNNNQDTFLGQLPQ